MLRRNVEMSRDAFDKTGRRYAVLWCASPRQLVSSCTVQLRVVAQRKVAFAIQRRWRGVDVLAMETSSVVKSVVNGADDEAKPFERWAPAYTPSVADVEAWFAAGNSVYVSLTASDSTLSTRPCRNGGTTIQEVMMSTTSPKRITLDVYADELDVEFPSTPDAATTIAWRAASQGLGFFESENTSIDFVLCQELSSTLKRAVKSVGYAATLQAPWAGHERKWRLGVLWLAVCRKCVQYLQDGATARDDLVARVAEAAAQGLRGRQPALSLLHAVIVARFANASHERKAPEAPGCHRRGRADFCGDPGGHADGAIAGPRLHGLRRRPAEAATNVSREDGQGLLGYIRRSCFIPEEKLRLNSSNDDDLCMRALHGLDDPKITPIKYDDDELLISILAQVPSKLPCFEVVPTQVVEAPEPEPQEPTKKKRKAVEGDDGARRPSPRTTRATRPRAPRRTWRGRRARPTH